MVPLSRAPVGGGSTHFFTGGSFQKAARKNLKRQQTQTYSMACAYASQEAHNVGFGTTVLSEGEKTLCQRQSGSNREQRGSAIPPFLPSPTEIRCNRGSSSFFWSFGYYLSSIQCMERTCEHGYFFTNRQKINKHSTAGQGVSRTFPRSSNILTVVTAQ